VSDDLDPRWEWTEVSTLDRRFAQHIKGRCNHLEVVPVISGDETVAHLCQTCDQQLPAEWRP
jgi:hypothetical protein